MAFSPASKLTNNFSQLLYWLEQHQLLRPGYRYDRDDSVDGHSSAWPAIIAKGVHRQAIMRKSRAEKEMIKKSQPSPQEVSKNKLWQAQKDPQAAVRELRWDVLPADALAIYRPFHYTPRDQWGIYLLADDILQYHDYLFYHARKHLLWDFDTLLHLMIFEIFNHEFFHHLVESTATYLEIIAASFGHPVPIYLDYKARQHQTGIDHPHHPLEEALANAYAYNALGFISRMKTGFKTATIKTYQAAIRKHWTEAPAGYRDAGQYVDGKHVAGSAILLEQILDTPGAAIDIPFTMLSKHLMPSGYTALFAKPDIPTWLVGSPLAIRTLEKIVPAINETYTRLFWPKDTTQFDRYIQRKIREEKNIGSGKKSTGNNANIKTAEFYTTS